MRIRRLSWQKCKAVTSSLPLLSFVLCGNCHLKETQPVTATGRDMGSHGSAAGGGSLERIGPVGGGREVTLKV